MEGGVIDFADDTVLVGDCEKKLQKLVNYYVSVCKKRKLAGKVGESKVMRIENNLDVNEVNISLNGSRMEAVECNIYLKVSIY